MLTQSVVGKKYSRCVSGEWAVRLCSREPVTVWGRRTCLQCDVLDASYDEHTAGWGRNMLITAVVCMKATRNQTRTVMKVLPDSSSSRIKSAFMLLPKALHCSV